MKIIDLLNKIANGEDKPKKIKYDNRIWTYDICNKDYNEMECGFYGLFTNYFDEAINECLNDEVEILEEEKKIPEKLNKQHFHNRQRQLANKINEIIDYLKNKGE